jgi:hypothetical protein
LVSGTYGRQAEVFGNRELVGAYVSGEVKMGWLSSPERIFKPSKTRFAFFLLGSVAFVVTETGRLGFRPYVRRHGINDFGITDSIGNLGGILVMIFLGCAIMNPNKQQSYRLAAFYSAGFVVYELVQPYLPKGVFDWMDVLGTGVGYLISVALLAILWRFLPGLDPKTKPV